MGKSLSAWIGGAILGASSLYSHAAGLGSLEVKSVLGEPLRAEVTVSATPAEIPSLAARLASPGAYEAAGLVYSGIVRQLAVTLNKSGSVPVLTITSAGPINEPVVDLLLELSWSSGRVSREYTAFIDPPFIVAERERRRVQEALAEAEAQAAAEEGAETRAASLPDAPTPQPLPEEPGTETVTVTSPDAAIDQTVETEPVTAMPEPEVVEETVLAPVETIGGTDPTLFGASPSISPPADEPMMAEETMTAGTGETGVRREPVPGKPIGVIRGDTLSKIALAHKPAGVTLEQMLVVLFRNNPDAFSANNMNRLRTGKIIRLGDPQEYRNVNQAQALQEVRVQYGNFKEYRARVAAAAMQQPTGEQPAQQAAAGTVTPKAEPGGAAAAQKPSEVVKLSRGEPAAAGQPGAGQAEAKALEEKLVASEKALNESNARVARLEKIIEDLQKLAEVQSQDMAKLQSQAASTAQPAQPAAKPMPAPAPPSPPQPTGAVKPAPDKPAATASTAPAQPGKPAGGEPTAPVAGQTTAQAPAPAPVPTAPTSEPAAAPAPAPKPSAQQPVRRAPPSPPPPAPTLLDQVLEQPYLLAVPIVVLLLVGLGVSRLRGRKREPKARSEEVAPATAAAGATAAASSKPGTFSPADTDVGIGSTDTGGGEEVDPLEEAEIFLAYGRDAQAEELLKEALTTHPARFEIHAKLAEIYAKRSDKDAFEDLAKQVQQGTGGEGENWDRVVRLGYSIDPDNPRYADGQSDDDDGEKTVVMRSEDITSTADRLDFEVGAGDSADSAAPDFDPSATTEFEASPIVDPEATMEGPIDDDVATMKIDMAEAGLTATDLDLNAELPELDSDHSAGEETVQSHTDTVGFDEAVPSMPETSAPKEDSGLDFNIEGISLDSDSEQKTMEQAQETMPDMPALDLSGITLDMDGATTATQAGSSGKDEKWYEVQTKFDLAKAYQEMGDNDGAKEILQEVITEGDSEQKAAAESVLATLD